MFLLDLFFPPLVSLALGLAVASSMALARLVGSGPDPLVTGLLAAHVAGMAGLLSRPTPSARRSSWASRCAISGVCLRALLRHLEDCDRGGTWTPELGPDSTRVPIASLIWLESKRKEPSPLDLKDS